MRYVVRWISVLTAVLLMQAARAADQSAPFGFSWGPVDSVPTPSLASREDNVTLLMYRRDRLPSDELRDTKEIVLEICKKEGLQQIVWISRLLSASGQRDKLDAIVAEGNRRYGQAELEPRGIIHWSAGRTSALTISDDLGLRRIAMVSTGPGLDACHLVGHFASYLRTKVPMLTYAFAWGLIRRQPIKQCCPRGRTYAVPCLLGAML